MMALSIVTARPAAWPGYQALLPVVGTALVLLAGRQRSLLTAPRLLQRLGDWSYSIYLWHWPVAVALAYAGWQGQPAPVLVGVALSLVLGWASYRWAEPLARKRLMHWPTAPALVAMGAAGAMVALPAFAVRQMNGVPGRLSAEVEALAAGATDFNPRRGECHLMGGKQFKSCVFGGPDIRAIVLGDSHASTIVSAVQAALVNPAHGVLAMSYTSCPTIFGVRHQRADLHCAEFNEWAMREMARVPASVPVIIANRASAYPFGNRHDSPTPQPSVYFDSTQSLPDKGYSRFLQEYSRRLTDSACRIAETRPVYLLRPLPEMPQDVPQATAREAELGRPAGVTAVLPKYHQRHASVWEAQRKAQTTCGVRLLDPLPYLCNEEICLGADTHKPRYYDDNHLTETGSRRLVPLFATALTSALPSVAASPAQ